MKIVIWARVSSREQKEGYSIDAQLRVARNKAERMGWEVAKEFAVAESARRGADRQEFRNMVTWVQKHAKKHQIKAILSHKLDRICRNMKDAVRMQELEDTYGIKLVFVDNEFGPGAAGMLSFNVMAAVAQYYSDNLRTEVLKGMDERIKQGWPIGQAPYGYISVKDKNEPVVPHPEKSKTVIRIFELFATGKYTFKTLAEAIYNEGYIYQKSRPKFHRTALSYILNNRVYVGELERQGKVYRGQYRLLIDPVLFERCQNILKGKNRRTGNPEILFSGGILRCAYCGSAMVGECIRRKLRSGGCNIHIYYRCTNNKPSADHPKVRWKEEDIEAAIKSELRHIQMPNQEIRDWARNAIQAFTADTQAAKSDRRKMLRKRKTELATMQNKLLDSFLAGIISEEVFNPKAEQLKLEAQEVEKQLGDLENHDADAGAKALKIFDFSQIIEDMWNGSNFAQKRTLLQIVSLNRHISDVSLCIEKSKPFDVLAKRPNLEDSGR